MSSDLNQVNTAPAVRPMSRDSCLFERFLSCMNFQRKPRFSYLCATWFSNLLSGIPRFGTIPFSIVSKACVLVFSEKLIFNSYPKLEMMSVALDTFISSCSKHIRSIRYLLTELLVSLTYDSSVSPKRLNNSCRKYRFRFLLFITHNTHNHQKYK